jgi:hypothetical protein
VNLKEKSPRSTPEKEPERADPMAYSASSVALLIPAIAGQLAAAEEPDRGNYAVVTGLLRPTVNGSCALYRGIADGETYPSQFGLNVNRIVEHGARPMLRILVRDFVGEVFGTQYRFIEEIRMSDRQRLRHMLYACGAIYVLFDKGIRHAGATKIINMFIDGITD